MCFGLAYFFYDVYAMYIVFKVVSNANSGTLKVCMFSKKSSKLKHNKLIYVQFFFKSFQTIFTFIQSRFLLVAHHLLLPFFIFPVFMGGLKSFNGGDCLVAAGFLLEASTPFVSLRKILAILGLCTNVRFDFRVQIKIFQNISFTLFETYC